jgi:hypothetical protein
MEDGICGPSRRFDASQESGQAEGGTNVRACRASRNTTLRVARVRTSPSPMEHVRRPTLATNIIVGVIGIGGETNRPPVQLSNH